MTTVHSGITEPTEIKISHFYKRKFKWLRIIHFNTANIPKFAFYNGRLDFSLNFQLYIIQSTSELIKIEFVLLWHDHATMKERENCESS